MQICVPYGWTFDEERLMLTIFTTPKPFRGLESVTQRNAIKSWTLLHPDAEVILLGDEEGSAEAAREFGIRHERRVLRNEHGTKYLNDLFERAQEIARHDLLCYVNCDIILMSDFVRAVDQVRSWRKRYLMVGRRWDVNVTHPWDFGQETWEEPMRHLVGQEGKQRPVEWIDYFVFQRGTYTRMPPFVIGRVGWDNWLLWKARSMKMPLVDASSVVMAVHQNHDYSYHPEGEKGVWQGEEAQRNYELAGGWTHLYFISDATHRLTSSGVKRNLDSEYFVRKYRRAMFPIGVLSLAIRKRLGMKQRG
jgi:hypothetical protein